MLDEYISFISFMVVFFVSMSSDIYFVSIAISNAIYRFSDKYMELSYD